MLPKGDTGSAYRRRPWEVAENTQINDGKSSLS
jgi:hypothetical protein